MTVGTSPVDLSRALRRRGAVVVALFALLWALVAASGLPSGVAAPVRVVAALASGAALGLVIAGSRGRRQAPSPERVRRQPEGWHRRVGVVNLLEAVAIALTVVVCVAADVPQLVPPVVSLVVGVHFVPLARLFDQPEYRLTAAGLVGGAVLGLAGLAIGPEASRVLVGSVAAGTLWATSLWLSVPRRALGETGRTRASTAAQPRARSSST
jgi:hypothetical protein